MTLQPDDFPLCSVGPLIYARRQSSPILSANNDEMAANIAFRLNRDHSQGMSSGGYVERPTPVHMVYGR